MSSPSKLLILDDDPDLLEVFRELLSRLPSNPQIRTATSGARALSMLESEPFTLLLSDLKMPKMDGLQVLAIVRRKFPHLRTAIMTSGVDEQFRSRAYAMGIDLFLEKPTTAKEIEFFLHCVESLLGRDEIAGFRGIQSKSLMDIIQLEALSRSSSVLKITNNTLEGRIWMLHGEIIDATAQELTGEEAFAKILSWKTGSFEILPPEKTRPRTIVGSVQGLLLEAAQAMDEAGATAQEKIAEGLPAETATPLRESAKFKGVEFIVARSTTKENSTQSWGVENPDEIAAWAGNLLKYCRWLGDRLRVGGVERLEATGLQRHIGIGAAGETELCVAFDRSLERQKVRESMKAIQAKWAS